MRTRQVRGEQRRVRRKAHAQLMANNVDEREKEVGHSWVVVLVFMGSGIRVHG